MQCRECKLEKNETDFYKHHKICKNCRIKKIKEWKKNNPEKVRASQKKQRLLNGDEIRKREARWRDENRERVNEIAKKYRENNRNKCRERARNFYHNNIIKYKRYQRENKDKINEAKSKWKERNKDNYRKSRNEYAKIYRKLRPKEHAARKAVYMAIKNNTLVRGDICLICGQKGKTEAHHYDYDKPVDVIWVCHKCHCNIHTRELR